MDGLQAEIEVTEKRNKIPKGLMIFLIIMICLILLIVIIKIFDKPKPDPTTYSGSSSNIAVIYIEGTIESSSSDGFYSAASYNHNWTLNTLDDLIEDHNNKGLVLFVDSPGGGVYESDEIYTKLLEYKETDRPIYISMGSLAASGGYYIAAPADKIFANRNTITGSIGVTFGTFYDISEFLDRYGIKTQTIASGANKGMGSVTEALTQEQAAIYQSIIDESYEQFVDVVASGRNMSITEVKKIADGRVYTAKQALNVNLVDEIGTLEDAINGLREDHSLHKCSIEYLYYEYSTSFRDLLFQIKNPYSFGEAGTLLNLIESDQKLPFSYYFSF